MWWAQLYGQFNIQQTPLPHTSMLVNLDMIPLAYRSKRLVEGCRSWLLPCRHWKLVDIMFIGFPLLPLIHKITDYPDMGLLDAATTN